MRSGSEKVQYESCPICSGRISFWRIKETELDSYNIDLCGTCGFAFVNPRPSLDFLMGYYSSFGNKHDSEVNRSYDFETILSNEQNDPNSTVDAKRMIKTIRRLNSGAEGRAFLDVGCGRGFFSKEAIDAGFNVTAIELSEADREITRKLTGLEPVPSSFEEFEGASSSYSVVFMSQILEHALDVNLWIQKAHDLLAKDGILAIALPNFDSIFRRIMQEKEAFICPPEHLNFFNSKSLSRLLEKHGFNVEAVEWVSRIPKRTFEKRLPSIAKPIIPAIHMLSRASLKVIDGFHLGMIINVYARKHAGC